MSATDELRPCPMCGSTDLKHYTTESIQSFRRGTVKCRNCGCTVRAEGGGAELFEELGFVVGSNGRYSRADYDAVSKESNARARKLSADKWNGVLEDAKRDR